MDVPSYLLGKKKGGGGTASLQNKTVDITGNGITTVSADAGYDGLRNVEIDTNVQPTLQTKSQTITTNTTTTITADNDYDGLSSVEITTNIPQPSGEISITENGSYNVSNYASASVNVSTSSEDDDSDLINFYDYDGTLVDSVRLSELPLSELPTPPAHEGLTFERWNWTLADVNALTYPMDVGALYTTTSGATELYFENISKLMLRLNSDTTGTSVINNLYIDWGDGTTELYNVYEKTHTYEHIGDYVVKITPVSNNFNYALQGSGTSSNPYSFISYSGSTEENYHLFEIRIGENCTKINNNALYNVGTLRKISLHSNCVLSQYASNISYLHFSSCICLNYIVLSPLQTYINGSFFGCMTLKGISFPKEFINMYDKGIMQCANINRLCISINCKNLGDMSGCNGLENIYTDENNTITYGFSSNDSYNTSKLRFLKNANFKTTLENSPFAGNKYITNLSNSEYTILSTNITSLKKGFERCINFKSLNNLDVLCPNLTTIEYICSYCYNLETVVLPNTITTMNGWNFQYCYNLKNVTLPNNLTTMSSYEFQYCYNLKTINIPSSVTRIGTYCFNNCYNLKNVNLMCQITTIQANTFYQCYSLTEIVLPSTLTRIQSYAFYRCNNIKKYDFTNLTAVPVLENTNAITINTNTKIVVPDDLYESWIAANNWSTFASSIVKESEYTA